MKKWMFCLSVMGLAAMGLPMMGVSDNVILKSTGTSGQSVRAVKAVVNYQDGSGIDIVPFSVDNDLVTVAGMDYIVKAGGGSGSGGNYQALDFTGGGGGASEYTSTIINGYEGMLQSGDLVWTETGNMSGPTNAGVDARLDSGEVRVLIPVIDMDGVSGTTEVEILGFKVFDLVACGGNGVNAYVTATFIRDATGDDLTLRIVDPKHVIEVNP